eukprot:TRINITY_DN4941_c0_g1_i1.p1 TRINITY_DN4941_c0_g1~~TRINITY_DN4941_c0_g1_i1.p1  ORF type:complete len:257 (+),score=62.86 TRINITY_DN4941_c0_g1_i1:304-1074(+)
MNAEPDLEGSFKNLRVRGNNRKKFVLEEDRQIRPAHIFVLTGSKCDFSSISSEVDFEAYLIALDSAVEDKYRITEYIVEMNFGWTRSKDFHMKAFIPTQTFVTSSDNFRTYSNSKNEGEIKAELEKRYKHNVPISFEDCERMEFTSFNSFKVPNVSQETFCPVWIHQKEAKNAFECFGLLKELAEQMKVLGVTGFTLFIWRRGDQRVCGCLIDIKDFLKSTAKIPNFQVEESTKNECMTKYKFFEESRRQWKKLNK